VQYFYTTSDNNNTAGHDKAAAEIKQKLADMRTVYGPNHPEMLKLELDAKMAAEVKQLARPAGVGESLGKRMIEGLNSDGTRETSTIDAGSIGNDRAIQIVSERWYSPELQTVVQSRHADPRTGEETFKLINVNRSDPPAYLFQVPANFQM
jgi:hypothetical protein